MRAEEVLEDGASNRAAGRLGASIPVAVDASELRSRCIERLCESSEEFIELVVSCTGDITHVSPSLARRLGRQGASLTDVGLSEDLRAEARAWLLGGHAATPGPRVLHFIDSLGHPFSARVLVLVEPGRFRALGLLTAACDVNEQRQLYSLNNELAVSSRELSRQRRQLETLVAQTRARELELLEAYQTIERIARTDPLTGLFNRRVLDEELPKVLERASLARRPVSVLVIDLDHFKQINDRFGHDAGDQVLAEVAAVMRRNTRENDLAVRLGGEELMLVLSGVGCDRALALANDLRRGIGNVSVSVSAVDSRVTASIGVATWTGTEEPLPVLLARADAAMYRAKVEGRDRCVVAEPPRPAPCS